MQGSRRVMRHPKYVIIQTDSALLRFSPPFQWHYWGVALQSYSVSLTEYVPHCLVCIFTVSCSSCGTPCWQPWAHVSPASTTAVTSPVSQSSHGTLYRHCYACLSCLGGKFTLGKCSSCRCIPEVSFSPSSVLQFVSDWSPWHQRPCTSGQSLRRERLHSVRAHSLSLY